MVLRVPSAPDQLTPDQARSRFRAGLRVPTAGWSAGWTQANLIAVPRAQAYDLLLFAQRNPKPCPTSPNRATDVVAPCADLRTDLPAYRVWRDGERWRSPPT